MREVQKPVFGSAFDVIFYAMMAIGLTVIVKDSIEGKRDLWQNVLLIAVAIAWLVQLYFKRRKRKTRD